jgi:hypothetical protein
MDQAPDAIRLKHLVDGLDHQLRLIELDVVAALLGQLHLPSRDDDQHFGSWPISEAGDESTHRVDQTIEL